MKKFKNVNENYFGINIILQLLFVDLALSVYCLCIHEALINH